MATFVFRLQALLEQRVEARKQAEEALAEYETALAAERQLMQQLEKAAEDAEGRYLSKRTERSSARANRGLPISNQDNALLGLKLDSQAAQSAVLSQQIFVEQAVNLVKEARAALELRRRDEDVLDKFRQKSLDRFLREESYREELEQDEIGNVMYLSKRE